LQRLIAFGRINEELSQFLYEIPILEGMEGGIVEQQRFPYGKDGSFEYTIYQKILRNKEGMNVSAETIFDFYKKHFLSKGFNAWSADLNFRGNRFQAPDLVTKGDAYIRSQGHISIYIPREGNFVSFWIDQRRDFDYQNSQALIDTLAEKMSSVSNSFGFEFMIHENMKVSDWPNYTANECFVERVISGIQYAQPERGSFSDDGSYRFYFSIFPTNEHARQWLNHLMSDNESAHASSRCLGFKPMTVGNIVIEYKGDMHDIPNADLKDALVESLAELGKRTKQSIERQSIQPQRNRHLQKF